MAQIKTVLTIVIVLFQFTTIFGQDWHLDLAEAQEEARGSDKNIILVFSGSDWCAPCIKLEREIWESEVFQQYAEAHYVMVRADFPRRKENKLSEDQAAKNAKLAEKYNPQGYFPLVVVMTEDAEVLGKTGYKNMSPEAYIQHLNSFIP
ncbi:MAG: thiol-disulfide isomerase [Anaerophaga sp.]|nr:thiol-disulfide isomerase [Anaerophaga sp.]MDK2841954.1 hypothetical protein [Anaerophaga sp.]